MPLFLPCTKCGHPSTDGNLRRGLCKRCHMNASARIGYECSYTDAAPVREHVAVLRAAGVGLRQIEAHTGVSRSVLQALFNGKTRDGRKEPPTKRVAKHTAERVLAMPLPAPNELHPAVGNRTPVPAIGTVRRLQALHAFGYTITELGREIGWDVSNMSMLIKSTTGQVEAQTARKVAEVFSRLQMVPPPSTYASERAKRRAAERGWKLPLFWDEDSIDGRLDDDHYVQDARADRRVKTHFAVTYAELRELGYRDIDIAHRMGIQLESLYVQIKRHQARIDLEMSQEGIAL